jgi:hypothetical protein
MNVEIGPVAAQFLFWEYLFRIFGTGSLQYCLFIPLPPFSLPPISTGHTHSLCGWWCYLPGAGTWQCRSFEML